jgi:hypothetical protein
MVNRVKVKVKQELSKKNNWDEAIREAETQLECIENRAESLRSLIADWSSRRDRGDLWPTTRDRAA